MYQLMKITFCLISFLLKLVITTGEYPIGVLYYKNHPLAEQENISVLFRNFNTTLKFYEVAEDKILDLSDTVCQHLQNGGVGFVSFLHCQATKYMDYYLSRLQIPGILYSSEPCDPETSRTAIPTIKLSPDCYILNKGISSVVKHQDWSEVVVLYDNIYSSRCLQNLLMQISKLLTYSRLVKISGTSNITQSLLNANNGDQTNVLVLVSEDMIDHLLHEASNAGMTGANVFWLIVETRPYLCWEPSSQFNASHLIVLRMQRSMDRCHYKKIDPSFIHDSVVMFDESLTALESESSHVSPVVSPTSCKDLKVSSSPWMETVRSKLSKTNDTATTGELRFDNDGYPFSVDFDILSTTERRNVRLEHVAEWNNLKGYGKQDESLFLNTFMDFGNRTLVIATQEAKPFTIRSEANGTVSFDGFCLDILAELAVRFNFRYKIIEPPDGLWGGPNADGTWNGMVGMVQRGEIAFAIGPFTITSLREKVIDFTKPFMEDGAGIITTRPDAESDKLFRMLRPFAIPVWGCIGISILCVGVLLFIVNRLSPYTSYNRKKKDSSPNEISLSSNMWLVFGTFVEQGGVTYPTAISGRCIVGFWWVFTILITSTYTANLAAFLTVTIAVKPINSLNELAAHQDIKPLVKAGTNLYSLFQSAESGIYKTIWNRMGDMPMVKNTNDALEIVRRSETAYMTDRSQLEYLVLKDCKTYALADEIFNTAGYGFVVPENAPFWESFNYNIMRMQEAGLIEKWRKKWWPRSDQCSNSDRTSSATALGIDSLAGPFLVYACIAVVSFICLLLEMCLYRRKRGKQKEKAKLCNIETNGYRNGVVNKGFE